MAAKRKSQPAISIQADNAVGISNASGNAKVNISQSSVRSAAPEPDLDKLFKQLEEKIKARPEDPNVDKAEIRQQVETIKAEAVKGEAANQSKLERWMKNLEAMAPDIVDVILASLAGPVSGFTAVFKKIAARAKAGASGASTAGPHDNPQPARR